LIYDHNKQVEQSVIKSANLGNFYRYVNGRLSCKSGVGPLKTGSGEVIVNDVEKAEVLNKYFTSVFTVDNGIFPDFGHRVDKNIFISSVKPTNGRGNTHWYTDCTFISQYHKIFGGKQQSGVSLPVRLSVLSFNAVMSN